VCFKNVSSVEYSITAAEVLLLYEPSVVPDVVLVIGIDNNAANYKVVAMWVVEAFASRFVNV
jgi:hypothetical protein